MSYDCPESVYGIHQRTDTSGRCLLCRRKIEKAQPFTPDERNRSRARHAQDPLSVDGPDESDYLDGFGGVA